MDSLQDKSDKQITKSKEYKLILNKIQKELIWDIKHSCWLDLNEKLKSFNTDLNTILNEK